MENEQFRVRAGRLDLLIEARRLPFLEQLRLARGQVCLHREIRFRQVERLFVILAHRERRG